MELAEGIRKVGFRRWHERQLIEGHLYLVTCILCAIVVLAFAEDFSLRAAAPEPLFRIAAMAASGWAGVWSLARYLAMLSLAAHAAERSVCRNCSAYGILEVIGLRGQPPSGNAGITLTPVRVRCRKCGHEWTIE